MKRLVLQILLQAGIMALFTVAAVCVPLLCFSVLPSPLHVILTFLGWVGTGIAWQETARELPIRLGLSKPSVK